MNLYKVHSDPKSLLNHDLAQNLVPSLVFTSLSELHTKDLSAAQIKALSKDAKHAAYYAIYILRKNWPEAEPYIMRDPESAFLYAINRIRGRWPEAEPYIMKDPYWWDRYEIYFLFD